MVAIVKTAHVRFTAILTWHVYNMAGVTRDEHVDEGDRPRNCEFGARSHDCARFQLSACAWRNESVRGDAAQRESRFQAG
jgi:hypothetical protein